MKRGGSFITRPLRYFYLKFVRLRGSAKDVARGMSLGVFIGITPTMGIQTVLALFFAMLLKENRLAAIIGVWISNPMTALPIYTFNFKIGKYLLGTPDIKMPDFSSLHDVIALGHDLLLPLFTGSIIVGVFSAAIAYVVTLKAYAFVKMEKDKLAHLKERKKARRAQPHSGEDT